MFDIENTRMMALQTHPPPILYWMLLVLVLVCSLMAGYGTGAGKARSLLHVFAFAAILIGSIYIIIDYEYPRAGLIRVDPADRMLVRLRDSMN
jgi:hypothetical protein